MQKYSKINPGDKVVDALLALNETHETLVSQNSGQAFPTNNLYVGMTCYREDLNKIYALRSVEPLVWALIADLNKDIYSVDSAGYANNAGYANSAGSAPANGGTADYAHRAGAASWADNNVAYGTTLLTPGASPLGTGQLYVVFEW